MYSTVATAVVFGIESIVIQAEADVCDGLPVFEMVGVLASEVREAKERIRAAVRNTGIRLQAKRITINLHPANIKKCGTGFDLPMTIALLAAYGIIEAECIRETLFIGEISLDGSCYPVKGILSITLAAKAAGYKRIMVPIGNKAEASYVQGIQVLAAENLKEALQLLENPSIKSSFTENESGIAMTAKVGEEALEQCVNLRDIHGQKTLRRALEISASGMHNMLMSGPPGAGKTMAARALPTLLPPLEREEELELIKIYSIVGAFEQRRANRMRPFRAPHHTITPAALAGGGRYPKPGEITLAHKGILFLDELTEFASTSLEVLRQPLEDKMILLTRLEGSFCYPADFLFIGAMNPCNCGAYPDRNKCICREASIIKHMNKISKPLLDRFDLWVEVPKLEWKDLEYATPMKVNNSNESSEAVRERVMQAHEIQKKRYAGMKFCFNSQIPSNKIEAFCQMEVSAVRLMQAVFEELELSARGYYKTIKTARTIADLELSARICERHIHEALRYRSSDLRSMV